MTEEYKQLVERLEGLWLVWSMRPPGLTFEDVKSFTLKAVRAEVDREREACAKIADGIAQSSADADDPTDQAWHDAALEVALAIRQQTKQR